MGRSVERKGGPAYSKGACPETNRREKAVRPGQDGPGARLTAGVTQSTRQQNCWARGGSTSLDPAAPPKAAPGGVVVGRQPTGLAPSSALPGIARIAAPRRAGGAPKDRASALLPNALRRTSAAKQGWSCAGRANAVRRRRAPPPRPRRRI